MATPRTTDVEGTHILVVGWSGDWYAIEDRCSHAGCRFSEDGEIAGFHAICDCHGSEFDVRTGDVLSAPAREPIATFRVRIKAGMIEIER